MQLKTQVQVNNFSVSVCAILSFKLIEKKFLLAPMQTYRQSQCGFFSSSWSVVKAKK